MAQAIQKFLHRVRYTKYPLICQTVFKLSCPHENVMVRQMDGIKPIRALNFFEFAGIIIITMIIIMIVLKKKRFVRNPDSDMKIFKTRLAV